MARTTFERKAVTSIKERTLVMVRRFAATPDKVFSAWTEAGELARWMGPAGFSVPESTTDPREGGSYRLTMRSPAKTEHTVTGTYCEMKPGERLVMTWAWEDGKGSHGPVTCVTVELRKAGKATEMRLHHALFEEKTERNHHKEGWQSSFDQLASYLRGKPLK